MDTTLTAPASILDHPRARALLAQATLTPPAAGGCAGRLTDFLGRYLPLFGRREQRDNATTVVEGLLSGLERKTCEPIAREHGVQRKPIQSFVGSSPWDDEAVMAELRRHVKDELADAGAVLVVDPSGFPKKGRESCGGKRQGCGRLGKVENCQVGVFLCYAAAGGHAPLDRRLYLPEDWAADAKRRGKRHAPARVRCREEGADATRREKCHVRAGVTFREKWRIALDMIDRCRAEGPGGLPHGWVAAD